MTIISNTGVKVYSSYDPSVSSNYVYTKNASTGADDGWVSARSDNVAVAVCVATLTASSFYYRIEGRTNSYTRPIEIYSKTKTAADTLDQIINICEPFNEIRIGVKTNCAATTAVHAGVIQEGVK